MKTPLADPLGGVCAVARRRQNQKAGLRCVFFTYVRSVIPQWLVVFKGCW